MDHAVYDVMLVDQNDVSADSQVLVMPRSARQMASKIRGYRVRVAAKVAAERLALLQASFLLRGQLVLRPKAPDVIVLMLLIPLLSRLAIVIVHPRVLLGLHRDASEQRNGKGGGKAVSNFH